MVSNERNKIIQQYYEQVKPDMSYEDFEKICKSPFLHARRQMSEDQLPEIRLMYFGKFRVFPGRVVTMLKKTQERFNNNDIGRKQYDSYIKVLLTFVRNNEDLFKKVKEKIKQWISL